MISTLESRRNAAPKCFACGSPGAIRHRGLQDLLFGVPGQWDLAACNRCGVLWVHPMPPESDITGFYKRYYTHAADPPQARLQGFRRSLRDAWARRGQGGSGPFSLRYRMALSVRFVREELEYDYMSLRFVPPGRVLDVGCGSGGFLGRMQEIGWQVEGVEMDPQAAAVARSALSAPVHAAGFTDATLPAAAYDAVTLSHVIEHVPDTLAYLREALRVSRPGATLVIATPNARALGHRLFRRAWRGLEAPRHLRLFTAPTLAALVEQAGWRLVTVRTSARAARAFFVASRMLWGGRADAHARTLSAPTSVRLLAVVFQALEDTLCRVAPEWGEEVLLVAEKPADVVAR